MDKTDVVILNTADDEELSDYFSNKEAGEECTVTITGKFLGLNEGDAKISVESVVVDTYDEEEVDDLDDEDLEDEIDEAEAVLSGTDDEDDDDLGEDLVGVQLVLGGGPRSSKKGKRKI